MEQVVSGKDSKEKQILVIYFILTSELTGFANGLDVGCKIVREAHPCSECLYVLDVYVWSFCLRKKICLIFLYLCIFKFIQQLKNQYKGQL